MTRKKRARRKLGKNANVFRQTNQAAHEAAEANGYPAGISFHLRYEPARTRKVWRVPAGYYDYRIVARKRSHTQERI